jgi:hypothetical protein
MSNKLAFATFFALAALLFWLVAAAGCGEADDASTPDDDDSSDDDGEQGDFFDGEVPAGVRLMIAGAGGVVIATDEGISMLGDETDIVAKSAFSDQDGNYLVVGDDSASPDSFVWRVDPEAFETTPLNLPVGTAAYTLFSGTFNTQTGRAWLIGSDDAAGTGLVLRRTGEVWERVEVEPPEPSALWWITAVVVHDNTVHFSGWDDDRRREIHFVKMANQDSPQPLLTGLRLDREFYPRRMFSLNVDEPSLWMTGSYMDAEFDPMGYWAEGTWVLAASCGVGQHRNWWAAAVDGKPTFVGEICAEPTQKVEAPESGYRCVRPTPMVVQYDPAGGPVNGTPGLFWAPREVRMPDAVRVVHVKQTEQGVYYLYIDSEGWLNLYDEGPKDRYRLTDVLADVHAARYF